MYNIDYCPIRAEEVVMGPEWFLIKPNGDLDHKLAGMPTELEPGYSLRCEEIIRSSTQSGNFHSSVNGTVGTANETGMAATKFVYEIVIEGSSLLMIESIRRHLKKKIGVQVGE